MKITTDNVLKMTGDLQPEITVSKQEEFDVNDIQIYRPLDASYDENVLYIMRPEELKFAESRAADKNICNIPQLVIYVESGSGDEYDKLKSKVADNAEFMAVIHKKNARYIDIFSTLNTLCAGDGDEEKNYREDIIDALYEEKEMDDILEAGARYLKNPIKLYNAAGILVMMSHYGDEYFNIDATRTPALVEMENTVLQKLNMQANTDEALYIPEDGFTENDIKYDRNFSEKISPEYKMTPAGSIYMPVKIKNILVGFAAAEGLYRPVVKGDADKLRYAVKIISMKLQYDMGDGAANIGKTFVKSIINDTYSENKILKMQHEMLENTFGKNGMRAMIVRTQGSMEIYDNRSVIKQIMRSFFNNCITLFYDTDIMLLLNTEDCRKLKSHTLDTFLKKNGLEAGISCKFEHLKDLQKFYAQADAACRTGKETEKNKRIHMYDELYVYDMLRIYSKEYNLKNVCHSAVKKLTESGSDSDLELLRTLYEYISCGGDKAKAASRLNIHRNTMYYRIDQIKKMTDTDIDDGKERFFIMLSFYNMNIISHTSPYDDNWKKASEVVFTENRE